MIQTKPRRPWIGLIVLLVICFAAAGIGTALLNRLIEEAIPRDIDSLVASISSKNEESIAFHRKSGFRECGRFERAGRKSEHDFDIAWMQRRIGLATTT